MRDISDSSCGALEAPGGLGPSVVGLREAGGVEFVGWVLLLLSFINLRPFPQLYI